MFNDIIILVNVVKKFLIFIVLILVGVFVYFNFFNFNKNIYTLLDGVNDYAIVDKYYIYGTHMNISGSIDLDNYSDIKLVFKSLDNELSYDLNYKSGKFYVSTFINDGIYLDDIPIGDYIVLIKVIFEDQVKYYSLKNDTDYNDISYYTVTKNNKNNLISINFFNKVDKDCMFFSVKNKSLPDNYYDVVIDPGHGGEDPGSSYASHTEAELNLEIALKLKKRLDSIGLKSILTRVDDTFPSPYGSNSRTSLPYDTHAKYFISIHLNSSDEKMRYGGVEVYAPNNCKLDFASSLASSIVNSTDTTYSKKEDFRLEKGVYVRTFTSNDIKISINEASEKGYKPYPINTDTNYYFMIRETGGIATGAYIDGRNKDVGKNNYYLSNVGAEAYLLELGYINYWPDLNKLVDNQDDYVDGIVDAFKS